MGQDDVRAGPLPGSGVTEPPESSRYHKVTTHHIRSVQAPVFRTAGVN